jgi:urease accessory protein
MVAVGIWAAQSGRTSICIYSGTFLVVMVAGGLLGVAGIPFPLVEAGILSSVVVMGLLAATSLRLPSWAACLLVGLFAAFHGHAHGTEMPASAPALLYAAGFALSTTLLLLNGALFGVLMQELNVRPVTRIAGAAIAVWGIVLAFAC